MRGIRSPAAARRRSTTWRALAVVQRPHYVRPTHAHALWGRSLSVYKYYVRGSAPVATGPTGTATLRERLTMRDGNG